MIPAARARHRRAAAGAAAGKRAALGFLVALGIGWGPHALDAAPAPGLWTALSSMSVVAQNQARPSRAHIALNTALECYRRGEYEQAAILFQQAQEGLSDLSPAEQKDLTRGVESNAAALQARKEGMTQLTQAQDALRAGRAAQAADLLKKVQANQYVTAADKQKAQQLTELARPRAGTTAPVGGNPANSPTLNLARTKLQQARVLLGQGNFDAAEQLANEADGLHAVYILGEDTPAKVLEDIFKSRTDPKQLLTAARAALKRGDLDAAEKLAQASARGDSAWNFRLWGDSPNQVLKEVQAARAKAGPMGVRTTQITEDPRNRSDVRPSTAEAEKPTRFHSVRGLFGSGTSSSNKPETPTAPPPPPTPPQATGVEDAPAIPEAPPGANPTETARTLLKQARQALQEGRFDVATQLVTRARPMAASLGWWDDTPDKVMADIQRAAAKRPVVAMAHSAAAPAPLPEKELPKDPHALVRMGRDLYTQGKYDEAAKLVQKARGAGNLRYGLFEDSPDKLQQDIDKARLQRDQEESAKILAEARKMYEQGELEKASREAYRAQKLHGSYSIWDLGDRPQKLLAEIETARSKKHRQPGASEADTPAVARRQNARPGEKDTEARAMEVRRVIAEAGMALRRGEVAQADKYAQQAQKMSAALDRPEDHMVLDSLRREIDARLAQSSSVAGPSVPAPGVPSPGVPSPAPMVAGDTIKQRAQELLVQCRLLQKEGRLVEARQKALEAQGVRAVFAPTEDSPELALIQLSSLSYKRIDNLVQEAAEFQQTAATNPANVQKAVANLVQARELALSFGFDTSLVEARLQVVQQPGTVAQGTVSQGTVPPMPGQPAGEVRVTSGQVPENAGPGMALLTQARQELRKGDTKNARKLAEQVYGGPYGMQSQAESVLRSVDAEEEAQRHLTAERTFDAGMSAFRRKEYAQSAAILKTINVHLLDQDRQAKLKNVFALPEMQPSQIAQVGNQEPAPGAGTARASDQGPPAPLPGLPGTPGKVTSTQAPDQDILRITQALQDVKFQQLRQQGLEVQRQAAERFKAGDTERALDILQDYVSSLSTSQLDSDRIALLRRPVESRLLTFKTLKAQRSFEKETLDQQRTHLSERGKTELTEQNKHAKVAELMQQYNSFYKEGKYKEAEMYAMAAFELDPDSAAAGAAVKIARIQRRQVEYQHLKDNKENQWLDMANDADDTGFVGTTKDPLHLDPERTRQNRKQRPDYSKGIVSPTKNDDVRKIEQLLTKPVNLSFKDTPLEQVLEDLRAWHSLNIVPDMPALDNEGISLSRPLTIKLDNVSLKSALNLLLQQVHLTYVIEDQVLKITTEAHAHARLSTATYQVADLIIPVENFGIPPSSDLARSLEKSSTPSQLLNTVAPYEGSFSLHGGSQASPSSSGRPAAASGTTVTKSQSQTMEESLIKLITNTIAPQTWNSMGGPGSIEYYPLAMALVINQTPDIQEQIAELLAALRRLQDQEVAIEMRFISVAEGFFERIGMDFNINIKSGNGNTAFGQQLTSQQFQQAGFINNFAPDRFVSGLTPAGAFTSDLNIPLNASSFGMAVPPFGGFPNIPGADGGLSLGLAFLSDIQVFLFMEAAQGDQRTNVMQAPKLTLSNGQTASITVADQQFFVTNVQVIQQGGQLAFVPQNTDFATGVTMVLQATISADRRFVRISFSNVTLSNLASATIPLFPIVTPIIPLFEGGFQGNPVLFTQFLQQPVFNTITVSTTVTVPDGGTVVLGGLKRLSEGRNEFGPPVISKIPYLNRLFRNQAYGREVESLLIMVTPRVIINEEEEERQVPGSVPPRQ